MFGAGTYGVPANDRKEENQVFRAHAVRSNCALLVAGLLLAPVLARAELLVEEGYVRGLPPGQKVTAAFMTLTNSGTEDLVLTSGSSAVAEKVEFHQHSHVDGMMRMRQVPELLVPAGGELPLKPGGLHLMLIGLQQVLQEGDTVVLELCAADGGCKAIELPVISVLNE
jgi:copper(I)-binding protein